MACEICINEQRIAQCENDLKRNSEQHREFYSALETSRVSCAVTDERYNAIMNQLNQLANDIKEMKSQPVKRWETIISSIITFAIGAGLTYLIGG